MSEGKVRLGKLVNLLTAAGVVWGGAAIAAPAVSLPSSPEVIAPRLYVLDCGTLVYNRPEFYNLTRDEVKDTNMPVTCYLVVHPKGTLLYDTGLSDSLVGRPLYENIQVGYAQIKFNTLRGQLAEIGVAPKKVDYLVISHWHFDHTGNANDYADAKWLGYQAERNEMFGPEARKSPTFQDYAALEQSKFVAINGEYDVFDDGTVKVIPTPGHTPGHSSLFVKLKNTGPIVLSGDLYHYEEERTLNRMPDREKTAGTPESRAAVEALLKKTGANLWVGHSMEFFKNVRKAPSWYD
ncbi:N-acyl homoserine lactonase family protein [Cupriavidus pauculus]|uniref:MBL fold hydrolase n=1 Tax=Cupriavidus pauculus TaxID=82633 RepID=A0A2N5C3D7_9BURK|nr:N-acyl homoserine lactonase family protein [Cupriavidus pauculus]PLP96743.1 MBL fold hydrolase [Cupriavidus pauculus]